MSLACTSPQLTRYGAGSSATTELVNDHRITLDYTVYGQIAPVAGIRDLSVFKHLDGYLYSVHGRTATTHDCHCGFGSTVLVSVRVWSTGMCQPPFSLHAARWCFSFCTL